MTSDLPDGLRRTLVDPVLCRALVARTVPHADADALAGRLAEIAALPVDEAVLAEVLSLLPRAAEPARTLLGLRRLLAALLEAGRPVTVALTRVVGPVISHSSVLGRLLMREPELALELAHDPTLTTERTPGDYWAGATALADPALPQAEVERALRRFRNREMLRIAARELRGEDIRETMRELSNLASALVEGALRWAHAHVQGRFGTPWADERGEPHPPTKDTPAASPTVTGAAHPGRHPCTSVVIGMGKLGGHELNYSSDIDLIYFYETDEGGTDGVPPPGAARDPATTPRRASLHEYHARLFELVSALLSKQTADGFCFRVDLGLRPEGKQGPVCNSLPAAEAYYESWGHAWERVAWLRARPVAGDLTLGRALLEMLRPFVYRRSLDPAAIDEIRRMKEQIDARAARAGKPGARGFDLKLGTGGVREIEFFANALQLVYGGRAPGVRDGSTLRAIDRLLWSGIIRREEHEALRDAYILLRRVEHRVQIREDRQTHELPADPTELDDLGRGLGLRPAGASPGAELLERVEQAAASVSTIYKGLLSLGTEGRSPMADAEASALAVALDERARDKERVRALSELTFRDPDRALEVLTTMQRRPSSPCHVRHAARLGELCRSFLREAARSSSPDHALVHLWELTRTLSDRSGVYTVLMDTPPVLRLLVTLFAASPLLARAVIRRPYLLDSLVFQGRGPREKEQAEMAREVEALLAKTADLDHALNEVRRYQTEELVRIGLLDIGGGLSVEEVGQQLTRLADTLAEAVLRLTLEDLTERHGPCPHVAGPSEGSLAIFGLGRLGSREMGYGSDIDIVFIYGGRAVGAEGADRHTWFTRLAQRFVTNTSSLLYEGRLYEVDTRLRPSGSQGTLVSSFEAFRAYHVEGGASWWERQALSKCRFVAGERALERPVMELVTRVVFRPDPPADLGSQMRRLRLRLESEVAREKAGSYNVKLGRGGIMDIEFAVQYLQLMHGYAHEALRIGNVYEVLRNLKETALLPAATTASLLEAYTFLRRLENRIRVVNDRPLEALDSKSEEATRLARRMGYGDLPGSSAVAQLVVHYRRHTEAVRAIYDALLPEESHGRQD